MTSKSNPTVLTYGQPIKHENWYECFYATVFTLEGYCKANGDDLEKALDRAFDNGHEIVGSCFSGACITTSKAFYEREDAIAATAVVLKHGEIVELEGRLYAVTFAQGNSGKSPRNSDPIKFNPI